jgi:hypothetical protein
MEQFQEVVALGDAINHIYYVPVHLEAEFREMVDKISKASLVKWKRLKDEFEQKFDRYKAGKQKLYIEL